MSKKTKEKKLPNIGGQSVMEGVMMRSGSKMAITVQKKKNVYSIKRYEDKQIEKKPWYRRWFFIRGVINFAAMLKVGIVCLNDSVKMLDFEEEEPSKFEKWLSKKTGKDLMDLITSFAMVLGIGLAVLLFIVLPNILTTFITKNIEKSIYINLVEGGIRLVIFVSYLLLISLMKDIKRFFAYHGAEHKTINAFEKGEKLTIENVQKQSTAHPRCGTSFLVFVMVISIIVFSLTGWTDQQWWQRLLMRIILLPVVASIAYELLMGMANYNNLLVRILRWPGMQVQKITTSQPEDGMVVTAIASALAVMDEDNYNNSAPQGYTFPDEYVEKDTSEKETSSTVTKAEEEADVEEQVEKES